jgi:hypothetical protein
MASGLRSGNEVTMNDIPDWDITQEMIESGGAFVRGLGNLYRLADADNQSKLKMAFPNYWKKYADIVRAKKAKQ